MSRDTLFRLRAAPLVERIHGLGPRSTHELIVELAQGREAEALERLTAYARLDYGDLIALGGVYIPPPALCGCAT